MEVIDKSNAAVITDARDLLKILHRGAPRLTKANVVSSNLTTRSTHHNDFTLLSQLTACIIVGFVLLGIYLDCVDWPEDKSEGYSKLFPFKVHFWKLTFYTIESNSLVGLYYLSKLTFYKHDTRKSTLLRGCSLMMISITMIVWHVILSKTIDPTNYTQWKPRWASHILHTIVPMLCWFDWLVIDKLKSRVHQLRKRDVPLFLICPLSYLAFSLLRAQFGAPYGISHVTGEPFWHWYPFIETSNPVPIYPGARLLNVENTYLVVVLNCLVIAMAIVLSGLAFVILDRKIQYRALEPY